MGSGVLEEFIADCRRLAASYPQPADCVLATPPLMHRLLKEADGFLRSEHLRADPDHYARNAIEGFLFSKPLPPAEFETLLEAETLPPRQAAE